MINLKGGKLGLPSFIHSKNDDGGLVGMARAQWSRPSVSVSQAAQEGQLALMEALLVVLAERLDEDISARDVNVLTLQVMRLWGEIKALRSTPDEISWGHVEPA